MTRHKDTILCHAGSNPEDNFGIVNPPVYHASTITFPTLDEYEGRSKKSHGFSYGRSGTPTTAAFETAITALHQGHKTVACPSGLAAISGALINCLKSGDHLLMVDTVYAPTRLRVCEGLLAKAGVETTYYDPSIGAGIVDLFQPNTKVVFLESPGSITFEMQDVPAITAACKEHGILTVIDNTWSSPYLCQPLTLGVDFVVEASTKYVVGHADTMMGTITVATESHYKELKNTTNSLGFAVGPDDCYLALRGLRTLSVRLERHAKNALKVAEWLKSRAEVERVLYPALAKDPGHDLWKRDHAGASALFGVILKPGSRAALCALCDHMEIFRMGASWGGYESLITVNYPEKLRTATPWTANGPLIRLHIGLEDPDDLIADLAAGLDRYSSTE